MAAGGAAAAAGIARERASPSPSSLAPAFTSTSPRAWPSVCASGAVPGAGCGLPPRSRSPLPRGLPPAFSGRAACGCQSRRTAIRLRAGSGPAPSVFLIKEAAAETRAHRRAPRHPARAGRGGGGGGFPPGPRPDQSEGSAHPAAPLPTGTPGPPRTPPLQAAPSCLCATPGEEAPPGTSRACCPWPCRRRPRDTPRETGGILVPPSSPTAMPHT